MLKLILTLYTALTETFVVGSGDFPALPVEHIEMFCIEPMESFGIPLLGLGKPELQDTAYCNAFRGQSFFETAFILGRYPSGFK
ncbi:MAG: hypothetical protein WCF94_00390 [bacterium]